MSSSRRKNSCLRVWLILAVSMPGGCVSNGLGVEPWERGVLARDDMALDSSPIFSGFDDHIYFSKEATSGGRGFSGGGCGCN